MPVTEHGPNYFKSVLFGICIGVGFSVAYLAGIATMLINSNDQTLSNSSKVSDSYSLLQEVQRIVSQVYLREIPDDTAIEYSLIAGYLKALNDPATFFIEPPIASSESQGLAGTYGGIGVQVKLSQNGQFLMYPYDPSPAIDAGISDGDILIEINKETLDSSMSTDIVQQKLRGEVSDDNGVYVKFISENNVTTESFIQFAVVNVPSVVSRLTAEDSSIGYIEIIRFTSRTPQELEEQLNVLVENKITGLIIDLRDNGGGLLNESIQVADQFLNVGDIVKEESREGVEVSTASQQESDFLDLPLVILVNQRTASASEIVAGALQDNGRAILIGQRTFGKGTVQQIFPLQDGSSIHVTSAEWFTPNNTKIQDNGLIPNIEMIPDVNGREVEFAEAIRYLQTVISKQSK